MGSNVWGVMSDIIGRRPVIIACTAISAAAAIGFGLARNLIWAIVARIITGEKMGKKVLIGNTYQIRLLSKAFVE